MATFKTTFGTELNIPATSETQYADSMNLELMINTTGDTLFSLVNFDKFATSKNTSVTLLGFVSPDPTWTTPVGIVPMNVLTTVKMTASIVTDANGINSIKVTSMKTNTMDVSTPNMMRIAMVLENAVHY